MSNISKIRKFDIVMINMIYLLLFITLGFFLNNNDTYFFKLNFIDYIILLIILCVLTTFKNKFNTIFSYGWLAWMFIGNFNVYFCYSNFYLYSYHYINNYNIDVRISNHIYLVYFLFFLSFLKLSEVIFTKMNNNHLVHKVSNLRNDITGIIKYILVLIPIASIIQIYKVCGNIPILTGNNISLSRFNMNYAMLYKYCYLVNIMSAIYYYYQIKVLKNNIYKKIMFIFIFFTDCLVVLAYGERYGIIIIILSIMVFNIKNSKKIFKKLIMWSFLLFIIYIVSLMMRSGMSIDSITIKKNIGNIGVEYRDWSYFVQYGNIERFNFFKSSVPYFLPKVLLKVFGLVRNETSADIMASFFNVPVGIRVGIIGELYWAYKYWGTILLGLLAISVAYCNEKINNTINISTSIFSCIWFVIVILSIMSQSNVQFNTIKNYVFMLIVVYISKIINNIGVYTKFEDEFKSKFISN